MGWKIKSTEQADAPLSKRDDSPTDN